MMKAYQLHFQDPVHFGIEGIGQESIELAFRSDSLWGAVLQKWFILFDDDPEEICTQTPFSISSCFPLINGLRFYPLPVGVLDTVLEEVAQKKLQQGEPSVKDWRRVRYIAEPLFRKILKGRKLQLVDMDLNQVYPMKHQDKNEMHSFFQQQEQRPRIMSDQLNGGVNESAFFYCTDQFFSDNSGLFFLAEFDSDNVRQKFESSLLLLGDSGVGADRSIGRGCFKFTSAQIDFSGLRDPISWLTLSLYHPTREEVAKGVLTGGRYLLIKRSGPGGSFHVSRFMRADCWMLEEGAVIPFQAQGDAPCVLKQSDFIPHNIYRNGRAFCVPLQGGAQNEQE